MTKQSPSKPHAIPHPSAVIIFLAAMVTHTAGAQDMIKPGKWERSVTVPGVKKLPPHTLAQAPVLSALMTGVRTKWGPLPEMRLGPEGMTLTATRCATAADPFPFPRKLNAGGLCKIDKTEVDGGTLRWSVTCATPTITTHQEWVEHYHGQTMDGQFTVRSTTPGHPPVETTGQIRGRYLAPCNTK
jgi:hypothetical protein